MIELIIDLNTDDLLTNVLYISLYTSNDSNKFATNFFLSDGFFSTIPLSSTDKNDKDIKFGSSENLEYTISLNEPTVPFGFNSTFPPPGVISDINALVVALEPLAYTGY